MAIGHLALATRDVPPGHPRRATAPGSRPLVARPRPGLPVVACEL